MMCGIDEAVRYIRDYCSGYIWAETVIKRLEYHRGQADGVKPKYHAGDILKEYYTCGNCGKRINIEDDYCSGCGYRIKWNTIRCLTGLPLTDAIEGK